MVYLQDMVKIHSFILLILTYTFFFDFVHFALLIIFGSYPTSKHLPVFFLSSFFFVLLSFLPSFFTHSCFLFPFHFLTIHIFFIKIPSHSISHVIPTNHIHNKFITSLHYIYIYIYILYLLFP